MRECERAGDLDADTGQTPLAENMCRVQGVELNPPPGQTDDDLQKTSKHLTYQIL